MNRHAQFYSHHCMHMYINDCIHKHKRIFALKDHVLRTYYAGLEACECETKRDGAQLKNNRRTFREKRQESHCTFGVCL